MGTKYAILHGMVQIVETMLTLRSHFFRLSTRSTLCYLLILSLMPGLILCRLQFLEGRPRQMLYFLELKSQQWKSSTTGSEILFSKALPSRGSFQKLCLTQMPGPQKKQCCGCKKQPGRKHCITTCTALA